jgi:hypothetical protein
VTYTIAQLIEEPSTLAVRELPDGRVLASRVKLNGPELTISRPEDLTVGIVSDAWEYAYGSGGYPTINDAVRAVHNAFVDWDGEGEPAGWTRHQSSGRRRPAGDARKEYVRP